MDTYIEIKEEQGECVVRYEPLRLAYRTPFLGEARSFALGLKMGLAIQERPPVDADDIPIIDETKL